MNFPECGEVRRVPQPLGSEGGMWRDERCSGSLIPVSIEPRFREITTKWTLTWKCTQCGRTL